MNRGSKETIGALALGGGLIALIAAVESRRGRSSAPVVMKGRWATTVSYHRVGFDPLQEIADATEAFAAVVSDAVDASGVQFGSQDERSAFLDRVLRAAFNQAKRDV